MEEKLMQDAARAYEGLQHIDAPMTRNNVAIVFDTLQVLQNIHAFLGELMEEKKKQPQPEAETPDLHAVKELPADDQPEEPEASDEE